jgi:hypothetical protein
MQPSQRKGESGANGMRNHAPLMWPTSRSKVQEGEYQRVIAYRLNVAQLWTFEPQIDAPAYQAAGVDMNVTFLMAVDAMDMTNGGAISRM